MLMKIKRSLKKNNEKIFFCKAIEEKKLKKL